MAVAPGRAARPFTVADPRGDAASRSGGADCPLCEGHEAETPPETYALRPAGGPPDSPGWVVRAVPNKYPVLTDDDLPDETPGSAGPERGQAEPDLFASMPARGEHEVIVHSPAHAATLAELPPDQFAAAVDGWRARLAAHAHAPYTHLIVNEGLIAGASLEHTHAQLYGLRFVPALVARERERFTAHNTRTMGGCLLCDLLQQEVRLRERVIAINDHAVLLAPYAARMPYELQLVPRAHARSIVGESDEADRGVADLLREGMLRLRSVLGGPPPLNLWLRTAPRDAEHFHWHIDVLPRLTQLAGLELGAGVAVNVYPPERVAADLRSVGEA